MSVSLICTQLCFVRYPPGVHVLYDWSGSSFMHVVSILEHRSTSSGVPPFPSCLISFTGACFSSAQHLNEQWLPSDHTTRASRHCFLKPSSLEHKCFFKLQSTVFCYCRYVPGVHVLYDWNWSSFMHVVSILEHRSTSYGVPPFPSALISLTGACFSSVWGYSWMGC